MRRIVWVLSILLVSVIGGAASAVYLVYDVQPTGTLEIGPWRAAVAVSPRDGDPYVHAFLAGTGQLPLAPTEGMRFVAHTDDRGEALTLACAVTVSGRVEAADAWTLSLVDPTGLPLGDEGLHSQDLVFRADGTFDLVIGSEPTALNTMLIAGEEPFALVLHIYGAPSRAGAGRDLGAMLMPSIELAEGCAAP